MRPIGATRSDDIKITVLVDNNASGGFAREHGLSMWIETPEGNVLLDTGQGKALAVNARKLGIDLTCVNTIVLSHGHYDHGNGLPDILGVGTESTFHAHPDAFRPRYSLNKDETPRFIGLSGEVATFLGACANRIVLSRNPMQLSAHVHLTGQIPRETDFEDTGGAFYLDEKGMIPDDLLDDQALWIETSRGVVVLMGCAHAGIINTLNTVRRLSNRKDILAVIGGLHLLNANPGRLQTTMAALERISPAILAPCHCTGTEAVRVIEQRFKSCFRHCQTGTRFCFDW